MLILSGPLPHFFFLKNPSRLSANFPPMATEGFVLATFLSGEARCLSGEAGRNAKEKGLSRLMIQGMQSSIVGYWGGVTCSYD